MQGEPQNMQKKPTYGNVVEGFDLSYLTELMNESVGSKKQDHHRPGFGFGKTLVIIFS